MNLMPRSSSQPLDHVEKIVVCLKFYNVIKWRYLHFFVGVCARSDELIRARRVELNIAATIEKMELCLPLLTTYSKLKAQVEAKRFV